MIYDLVFKFIHFFIHFRHLMMYKYVIVESDCAFNLEYYPFDNQNCQITLAYQGNQGEIIKLIAENITYLGPTTMKQYDIDPIQFKTNQENKIIFAIKFRRNILREVLTIIFPTILIVFVSIHASHAITIGINSIE